MTKTSVSVSKAERTQSRWVPGAGEVPGSSDGRVRAPRRTCGSKGQLARPRTWSCGGSVLECTTSHAFTIPGATGRAAGPGHVAGGMWAGRAGALLDVVAGPVCTGAGVPRARGGGGRVAGAGAPQTRTGCHSHGPRRSAARPRMGGLGHRGAKRLCPLPGPLGGRRFLEERHWGQHFGARRKQSRAQGRAGLRCSQHRGLGLPGGNRGSRRQGRGGGPRPVAPFRTVCSVGRARWGWGRC